MQCKTENGQKCNDNWCKSWWLPSRSKWYPLVLRSNWKSLGWIIKIRLHFIISPQPCCLRDQVRCWCYTQLKADTKTGIIFLSVALWMDIKGINQLCRIRKRIIDLEEFTLREEFRRLSHLFGQLRFYRTILLAKISLGSIIWHANFVAYDRCFQVAFNLWNKLWETYLCVWGMNCSRDLFQAIKFCDFGFCARR